jgi:predicted Abi (CAAX) family protease
VSADSLSELLTKRVAELEDEQRRERRGMIFVALGLLAYLVIVLAVCWATGNLNWQTTGPTVTVTTTAPPEVAR